MVTEEDAKKLLERLERKEEVKRNKPAVEWAHNLTTEQLAAEIGKLPMDAQILCNELGTRILSGY